MSSPRAFTADAWGNSPNRTGQAGGIDLAPVDRAAVDGGELLEVAVDRVVVLVAVDLEPTGQTSYPCFRTALLLTGCTDRPTV
jgi:hypothetical protein